MKRISTSIAAIASAAALAVPIAAHAQDGNIYAYRDAQLSGPYCAWQGDDPDWGTCSPAGSMLNQAAACGTTATRAAKTT